MKIKANWRDKLKRLPDWVQDSISKLGNKYDYIAFRLAERVDDFNVEIKEKIERSLTGTTDPNCIRQRNAFEQRVEFFIRLLQHADYYRPTTEGSIKHIPDDLQPRSRPTAVDDLKEQSILRKKISTAASDLATLLRQHAEPTKRLGVRDLECNPLDLIDVARSTKHVPYLEGIEQEFNQLSIRKMIDFAPTYSMASLMDELSNLAALSDQSLIPAEVLLGTTSRKSTMHLYEAFNIYLGQNREEDGGFIPTNFSLSDQTWALLLSCLTYAEVSAKSIQMYRGRLPGQQDKVLSTAPRFDIDKLLESWERKEG